MVGGPAALTTRLRLATFNCQRGRRPDGVVDLPLLAAACASLDADVLALQEVYVRPGADPLPLLSQAAGGTARFVRAVRAGGGDYGNALVVRGEIGEGTTLRFPEDTEPRVALLATVVAGGVRVAVAATHLGLRGQALDELPSVVEVLARRPAPRALLGDLNLGPRRVRPLVEAAGLVLVDGAPTHPATGPRRRLDHVAVGGLDVVSAEVRRLPVSDHLAVVVDVTLPV